MNQTIEVVSLTRSLHFRGLVVLYSFLLRTPCFSIFLLWKTWIPPHHHHHLRVETWVHHVFSQGHVYDPRFWLHVSKSSHVTVPRPTLDTSICFTRWISLCRVLILSERYAIPLSRRFSVCCSRFAYSAYIVPHVECGTKTALSPTQSQEKNRESLCVDNDSLNILIDRGIKYLVVPLINSFRFLSLSYHEENAKSRTILTWHVQTSQHNKTSHCCEPSSLSAQQIRKLFCGNHGTDRCCPFVVPVWSIESTISPSISSQECMTRPSFYIAWIWAPHSPHSDFVSLNTLRATRSKISNAWRRRIPIALSGTSCHHQLKFCDTKSLSLNVQRFQQFALCMSRAFSFLCSSMLCWAVQSRASWRCVFVTFILSRSSSISSVCERTCMELMFEM